MDKFTIDELVKEMTLDEKASLLVGKDYWHIHGVSRLGIDDILVSDGPNGLRTQLGEGDNLGIQTSIPATCFPTLSSLSCSFDTGLLEEVGRALAKECIDEKVSILLAPGVNIKRSPLGGRNFEYFSEDPYLTYQLGKHYVKGVQSLNIGVSLKHFAFNNQETARFVYDSVIDDRAAREIYLYAFERIIKEENPWTVMCSYNKMYGEYASENKILLNDILRKEWNYHGAIISDWGATSDRVKGLKASLDVEMPGVSNISKKEIIKAVKKGKLSLKEVDESVKRVLYLLLRAKKTEHKLYDKDINHKLAVKAAEKSIVLLKNEDNVLPFTKKENILVVGEFAAKPKIQGGGSAKVEARVVKSFLDVLDKNKVDYTYTKGYEIDKDVINYELSEAAKKSCEKAKIIYFFAGSSFSYEMESTDKKNIELPYNQINLIKSLCKINPNIVLILVNSSPVDLHFIDQVKSIVYLGLAGEGAYEALYEILNGKVNPSGKLSETWPLRIEDNPSYTNFPGDFRRVLYKESIYVGYRFYDTAKVDVRFPFGYGLSYTKYSYSSLVVKRIGQKFEVTYSIKNDGLVDGEEISEVYIHEENPQVFKANKELKAFSKTRLKAGEEKEVKIELDKKDFAYYNKTIKQWVVENGHYTILVAASLLDIKLYCDVKIDDEIEIISPYKSEEVLTYFNLPRKLNITDEEFKILLGRELPLSDRPFNAKIDYNSTVREVKRNKLGNFIVKQFTKNGLDLGAETADKDMLNAVYEMIEDIPLRYMQMMGKHGLNKNQILGVVDILNKRFIRGIYRFLKK